MPIWLAFILSVASLRLVPVVCGDYNWNVSVIDSGAGSAFDNEFKLQTALNNEMQNDLQKISGGAASQKLDSSYMDDYRYDLTDNFITSKPTTELINLSLDFKPTDDHTSDDTDQTSMKKTIRKRKKTHRPSHKHRLLKKGRNRGGGSGSGDKDTSQRLLGEGEVILNHNHNKYNSYHKDTKEKCNKNDEDDEGSEEGGGDSLDGQHGCRGEKKKALLLRNRNKIKIHDVNESEEDDDEEGGEEGHSSRTKDKDRQQSAVCKHKDVNRYATIDADLEAVDTANEKTERDEEDDEEDEGGEGDDDEGRYSPQTAEAVEEMAEDEEETEDIDIQPKIRKHQKLHSNLYKKESLEEHNNEGNNINEESKDYPPDNGGLRYDEEKSPSLLGFPPGETRALDDEAVLKDFVGTNIFINPNKRCFSTEDTALLSARKDFERLIPKELPRSLLDDDSISMLMNYFYTCHRIITRMTNNESKRISQKAYYDTIGGYLNWYLVPVTKYSFYAGRLSLQSARNILLLHKQCKNFLNINGNGWRMPMNDVLRAIKNTKIEPLHLDRDINTDEPQFCMHLDLKANNHYGNKFRHNDGNENGEMIYSDDNSDSNQNSGQNPVQSDNPKNSIYINDGMNENAQLLVPLPQLDTEDRNEFLGNIWLPFKRRRTYDLRADNSAYIVVKFFETVTRCHQYQHLNQELYNKKFRAWLRENVEVHLSDDEFYPGLGAILRVNEKLKIDEKSSNLYGDNMVERDRHFGDDIRVPERRQKKHSLINSAVNMDTSQNEINKLLSKDLNNKIYGNNIVHMLEQEHLRLPTNPSSTVVVPAAAATINVNSNNSQTSDTLLYNTAQIGENDDSLGSSNMPTNIQDPTDEELIREDEKCKALNDAIKMNKIRDFASPSSIEVSSMRMGLVSAIKDGAPVSYFILAVPLGVVFAILVLCWCRTRVGQVTEKAPTAKGRRMRRMAAKPPKRALTDSPYSSDDTNRILLPESNTSLMSGSADNITCSPRRPKKQGRPVVESTSLDYTSSEADAKRTPQTAVPAKAPSSPSKSPVKDPKAAAAKAPAGKVPPGKAPPGKTPPSKAPPAKPPAKPPPKQPQKAPPPSAAKPKPSTTAPAKPKGAAPPKPPRK